MNRPVSARAAGVLFCAVVVLAMAFPFVNVIEEANRGGGSWLQGDWLINIHQVHVRRGPLGSAILWLSDVSGMPPVITVSLIQLAGILALTTGVLWAALRLGSSPRLVVIMLCPATVTFWSSNPDAAGRKELLVYLALTALVAAALGAPRRPSQAAAAGFMGAAVIGHEAMILLVPIFAAALYQVRGRFGRSETAVLAFVVTLSAAMAAYAVTFSTADPNDVCRPLLDRDVTDTMCAGAIAWLDRDFGAVAYGGAPGAGKALAGIVFLAVLAALAVPARVAFAPSSHPWRPLGVASLSLLACAPLFVVAIDWGRFVAVAATSTLLLGLVCWLRRRPDWMDVPMRRWVFVLLVGGQLIWTVDFMQNHAEWGFLPAVWEVLFA